MAAGAVCVTAGVLTATQAMAQHSSPKPISGRFIQDKNMDKTVPPGDDFFTFANGNWVKSNPIPAKEVRYGTFTVLRDNNNKNVQAILVDAGKGKQTPGSVKQRVGDLYASAMDTLTIEKRGYAPIRADLERLGTLSTPAAIVKELSYQRVNGLGGGLVSVGVGQDSKHPDTYIVSASAGSTSLPDRDNYLKNDARSLKIQAAFKKYVADLFVLTGVSQADADKNANTVYNLEKKMAERQKSRVELRDPNGNYNKVNIDEFSKQFTNLNFRQILADSKITGQDSMLVSQPKMVKLVDSLLTAVSPADIQVLLKWNLLRGNAGSLSSPFVNASFAYSSTLSGQKVQTPRNERMASLVDGSLGDLLGQLYVEKHFPQAAKTRMLELVNNLKVTLGERIQALDWMSAETKKRALKKLESFSVKIAFPDKWETYNGLTINRNDYYGNLKRISVWRYNENVNRLGKPVDKTRMGMTPPTVNASYSPTRNEITFPAGILQAPFFDFDADDAMNYGGIGAVIGHEMIHGFDDQGRQYDADGALRDWWTKEDAAKFLERSNKVIEQFNAFTVLDTIHVNGKLTQGENIADLGGLNVAYAAFKKTKQGQSNVKIDGFTPDQRFFMSWGQVWRSSQRPESAAQRIQTDPHSPEEYRTNAPLTNIDAWYNAFDIKPTNKLYKKPEDRIRIW
ncbi:M13 family metallopeptidase [Mucilaginibacter myungsuensis]|uniref:M13 family metallopeptidase n=2 Tax=Mucilaginibacter myungsuensis TaxID=649104 RepID=A0A929PZL0_9SPHI|nr:M13 family metallopeptidase [Mucilaginibacter myungsuensis]